MARVPIQIGPKEFDTKSAAKTFCRELIKRYKDGVVIVGMDDLFLRDLVAIHPEAKQKLGGGIAHFTIQLDPEWRTTRHLVIVRLDGSATDVSFHICIDGSNDRRDVFHGLRRAIVSQIVAYKTAAYVGDILPICPYTGAVLSYPDGHIDHAPPNTFLTLATGWMQANGWSVGDVALVDNADNQWCRQMRDSTQSASWQAYHREHARLRVISRVANLSHVKRMARSVNQT